MNTKYLMIVSSIFLGLIGFFCTFAPSEILSYLRETNSAVLEIVVQVLGALYLGFALLNWTAKANLIGGIYSKPVSLGNFLHFVVGGLALAKYFSQHLHKTVFLVPVIFYLTFAIAFGLVLFGRHEFKKQA